MRPPCGFLRCTPNYEADRAEVFHSLWGIVCATFGKKVDRVMSGHGAMTSPEEYGTLEGDIEASFDYFRSELIL